MDTLLERALAWDEAALAEIFDQFYTPLYRYAYYHSQQVQDAEDIAAQVFQRFLQALQSDSPPQKSLQAWLYRTCRNLIIDYHRQQKHRQHAALSEELSDGRDSVEKLAELALTQQTVFIALASLSENHRDVLFLRFVQGLSLAESAEILEQTVGAVKALQHRALKQLRDSVGEMV